MPEIGNLDIWLKGEELGKEGSEMQVEITSPHKMVKLKRQGEEVEVEEIEVRLPNLETRRWIPNRRSIREIAKRFGKNSDRWVGKKITLYTVIMRVFKEDKPCIFVKALEGNGGKKNARN